MLTQNSMPYRLMGHVHKYIDSMIIVAEFALVLVVWILLYAPFVVIFIFVIVHHSSSPLCTGIRFHSGIFSQETARLALLSTIFTYKNKSITK